MNVFVLTNNTSNCIQILCAVDNHLTIYGTDGTGNAVLHCVYISQHIVRLRVHIVLIVMTNLLLRPYLPISRVLLCEIIYVLVAHCEQLHIVGFDE
jgi:hypothetical protein